MSNWLDFKLFGNGHGLKSPFWDDKFYFLSGRFYNWVGGFGVQLQSFEWFTPKIGERRMLCGIEFAPYSCQRKFLRVRVGWALTRRVNDYREIRELKRKLDEKV